MTSSHSVAAPDREEFWRRVERFEVHEVTDFGTYENILSDWSKTP